MATLRTLPADDAVVRYEYAGEQLDGPAYGSGGRLVDLVEVWAEVWVVLESGRRPDLG